MKPKTNFISTNSKLKKDGIVKFTLPAFRSCDGELICFGADACVQYCYAQKGFFRMPSNKKAHDKNYQATKLENFPELMTAEIKWKKPEFYRIHDGGDMYSLAYLNKWLKIIQACPETHFYTYTKSIPLFLNKPLPKNFTVIYSLGSKFDAKIDTKKHRHAKIFETREELLAAGYTDTSVHDINAIGPNHRIGLIAH